MDIVCLKWMYGLQGSTNRFQMITKSKHMVGSGSSLSWVYCNNHRPLAKIKLRKNKNMETYIKRQ